MADSTIQTFTPGKQIRPSPANGTSVVAAGESSVAMPSKEGSDPRAMAAPVTSTPRPAQPIVFDPQDLIKATQAKSRLSSMLDEIPGLEMKVRVAINDTNSGDYIYPRELLVKIATQIEEKSIPIDPILANLEVLAANDINKVPMQVKKALSQKPVAYALLVISRACYDIEEAKGHQESIDTALKSMDSSLSKIQALTPHKS